MNENQQEMIGKFIEFIKKNWKSEFETYLFRKLIQNHHIMVIYLVPLKDKIAYATYF